MKRKHARFGGRNARGSDAWVETQRGGERIGDTLAGRLRWLLHFQREDVARLSDAKARDLGWEIIAFVQPLGHMPDFTVLAPLPLPGTPPSRAEIQTFQRKLSAGLDLLFRERQSWALTASIEFIEVIRWPDELVDARTGAPVATLKGQHPSGTHGASGGNRIDVRFHMQWPHSFWAAVASTLSVGAWWLRLCRRCGTLFVGTKRQEYCRSACSQAIRTRTFREAKKTKGTTENTAGESSRGSSGRGCKGGGSADHVSDARAPGT